MSAQAQPTPEAGYWSRHRTIVITWSAGMRGVFASARWRRNEDGSLSVEYTREELELAVGGAKVSRQLAYAPPADPAPECVTEPPARTVFGRLSAREGAALARQAQTTQPAEARQEALL